MNDRALIRTGAAGAIVATICCATLILALLLPVLGLSAWLVRADLVLFTLLAGSLGLVAWSFYLHRTKATCCEAEIHQEGLKP